MPTAMIEQPNTQVMDPPPAATAVPATQADAAQTQQAESQQRDVELRKAYEQATKQPAAHTEDGKFKGKDDASAAKVEGAASETKTDDTEPQFSFVKVAELGQKTQNLAKALNVESDEQAFDVALEAYQRDPEYDEALIQERLEKDPKRFVERGLAKAKYQAEIDKAFEDAKAYRKQADGKGNPDAAKPQENGQHQQPVPLAEAVKDEITKLTESIPEDDYVDGRNMRSLVGIGFTTVAEKMAAHHEQQLTSLQKQYEAKMAERDAQLQWLSSTMVDQRIEQTRSGMLDKYPDLKNQDVQEKVNAVYDKLAESGQYDSPEKAYRVAVIDVLGEESINQFKQRLINSTKARKAAQPHKPTSTNQGPPPDDRDAQLRDAFERATGRKP